MVSEAADIAASLDWSDDPLFHPLRLALTGRESGPEMAGLLARIGKDRAVERLRAAAD
jgi:glutamyl-tRNA synthetase